MKNQLYIVIVAIEYCDITMEHCDEPVVYWNLKMENCDGPVLYYEDTVKYFLLKWSTVIS